MRTTDIFVYLKDSDSPLHRPTTRKWPNDLKSTLILLINDSTDTPAQPRDPDILYGSDTSNEVVDIVVLQI